MAASSASEASVSLRVAGSWSGEVTVQLSTCRLSELRKKVAEASGFDEDGMKLICGGRMLKDDGGDKVLSQIGVTEKSKLLVTKVSAAQVQDMAAEAENARLMEERTQRLARLKSAADAMARRSGGDLFPSDGYELQLENQEGQRLQFSDEDRRALVMGLALHAKAGKLMEREEYKDALEVLELAEEAFALCNKVHLEAVDNVSLLQIDTVWCLYMLKDVARLAVARERLTNARAGLRKAHGAHLERLRMLQGGFCPELALYVRLETLEGVVAFHSGQPVAAKQALQSAEGKYKQLQVSDESLVKLTGMGFSLAESRRALRVSGQDPERATIFALEQRRKDAEKREEDKQRRKERRWKNANGTGIRTWLRSTAS
ncbi:ubiquitin-associated (UBA)/TS-N domain-containing protein [Klebsormidium nitens]|uniref:Ubiquitin-associated (UBA)/TS-N domain-containing protein n=1 Tax=Klebsormidium nitens TaxID=105231 RepID=A0A1Y1HNB1_KLENI|nr:ubiquitin-associated (UBA)/TS-N domain-containing protein [Klebsormidium nitens]|eukprot:GAQ78669.1 ubiquitin-associated (UBA)/TS-N domain-containing protein [Klebsormidium nitens]